LITDILRQPFSGIGKPEPLKGKLKGYLAEWMGGEKNVSEFFKGARSLSLPEIETLREHLGIPADLLIGGSSGDCARGSPGRA